MGRSELKPDLLARTVSTLERVFHPGSSRLPRDQPVELPLLFKDSTRVITIIESTNEEER